MDLVTCILILMYPICCRCVMMNAASSSVTDTAAASLMEISTVTDTHSSTFGTISPTTTTPIVSAMMESDSSTDSASASVEPSPSSTPITRPPSTCFEQVDHIFIELAGAVNNTEDEILNIFCEDAINETNVYCNQNWVANCQLPANFGGQYTLSNCHACFNTNVNKRQRKRQTISSSLRYFITQPDNSNSVLSLNAMQHVTRQTLPSFQAATGLVAVHITTVSANPPTSGHPINKIKDLVKFISIWGAVGGLMLACLVAIILFSICFGLVCLIKIKVKKKKNSVKPNKSGSTSSEKGETADTIHLTR